MSSQVARSGAAAVRDDGPPDRGAGLLSSAAGLLVFLGFLLLAVQLLVDLHAQSVVSDAAYSGARAVAGARVDHDDPGAVDEARRDAEARVRSLLGRQGASARFDWSASSADEVALRVVVDNPRFAVPGLPVHLGVDQVDRTVRLRVERFR